MTPKFFRPPNDPKFFQAGDICTLHRLHVPKIIVFGGSYSLNFGGSYLPPCSSLVSAENGPLQRQLTWTPIRVLSGSGTWCFAAREKHQKWREIHLPTPGDSMWPFWMVKWPFQGVKWPPTRGWKGHFESPGHWFFWFFLLFVSGEG